MARIQQRLIAVVVGLLLVTTKISAQPGLPPGFTDLIIYDAPGSTDTLGIGINDHRQVVGRFRLPETGTDNHSFIGRVERPPGKSGFIIIIIIIIIITRRPGPSQFDGINNDGFITGTYGVENSNGFIRDPEGFLELFDVPGSIRTFPYGISNNGYVSGYFDDASGSHAFIRHPDVEFPSYITVDAPGSVGTFSGGINDSGQLAGSYNDAADSAHGFIRESNGTFIIFDVPGSVGTEPSHINNAGSVAGSFLTFNSSIGFRRHGFVRHSDGTFTVIDVPGARNTIPAGINNLGDVSGSFDQDTPTGRVTHGFVLLTGALRPPMGAYQLKPFTTQYGDSIINVTKAGTSGNGADPSGTLCANFYAFGPNEKMISCCACQVSANGLKSLSVSEDLISNALTPSIATSGVIKLLGSTPVDGSCNASVPTVATLVPDLQAWGTTLHALPTTSGTVISGITEAPFSSAELSDSELQKLTSSCSFIQANGSGFGQCKSCRTGGLGAEKK